MNKPDTTPSKEQILRTLMLYFGQQLFFPQTATMPADSAELTLPELGHIDSYYEWYIKEGFPKLLLRETQDLTNQECKEIARLALGYTSLNMCLYVRGDQGIEVLPTPAVKVIIFNNGSIIVERGKMLGDALSFEIWAIQNQSLIQQYLLQQGISIPLLCLNGLTPVQAKIAAIKEKE